MLGIQKYPCLINDNKYKESVAFRDIMKLLVISAYSTANHHLLPGRHSFRHISSKCMRRHTGSCARSGYL